MKTILQLSIFILIFPPYSFALRPSEVVVVANTRVEESIRLAAYYMNARSIPDSNLVKVSTSVNEVLDRDEFQDEIRRPVREKITTLQRDKRIRAIVSIYGIPLKIRHDDRVDPEKVKRIQQRKKQLQALEDKKLSTTGRDIAPLDHEIQQAKLQLDLLKRMDTRAAVDSELALVLADGYPLDSWLPNPYFLGFQGKDNLISKNKVLIASRLDGPVPWIVQRVIDDSIAAEKEQLKGQACFDARWNNTDQENLQGYLLYDNSIHQAAISLDKTARLPVTLNHREALFQRGDCPNTAVYCGWYSLANYIDAFEWAQGSVGYHIASAECKTLRQPNSNVWCKRMLEMGIAATIGPVYEPYVQGFPLPEIFFTKLAEGYLSLGETYLISLPYLSWQMVLVGDPLYRPFKPTDGSGK